MILMHDVSTHDASLTLGPKYVRSLASIALLPIPAHARYHLFPVPACTTHLTGFTTPSPVYSARRPRYRDDEQYGEAAENRRTFVEITQFSQF
jgi:hypothetical protein